jgi:hypothetical protein
MLKDYKVQAILGIWGGVLFFSLGFLVGSIQQAGHLYFSRLIMAGGYLLFVCGCFMYVRGKGRSWYWGILGVFGPAGLLFLYCLKDRSRIVLKKHQKELA